MTDVIRYEVRERVATVTLENGKANALSPEVIAQVDDAIGRAEQAGPDEVGVLVITGRPGMLCGGFDLEVIRRSPADAGALVTAGGALFTKLLGSSVPVVVGCGGHAVAAGALLLLSADERIGAAGSFRIGLNETSIGMALPRWAVELAEERLSRRHFQLATVGARLYDPAGARDAGYLDAVVEPDALDTAVAAAAGAWAALPRSAYRRQVQMLRGARLDRLQTAVDADRGQVFGVSD
jgi:enoyl-CoA hydratase